MALGARDEEGPQVDQAEADAARDSLCVRRAQPGAVEEHVHVRTAVSVAFHHAAHLEVLLPQQSLDAPKGEQRVDLRASMVRVRNWVGRASAMALAAWTMCTWTQCEQSRFRHFTWFAGVAPG